MPDPTLNDRFLLRAERFDHPPFSAEILLPASADALIDENEFDGDERLPYWAELWPAARALARVVLDQPVLPASAIEVGCGLGLPSLALCHRGVVTLATDYYADALLFVDRNAEHNGIAAPSTRLLDWRHPPADLPRFPLVLAADVLYEARNIDALRALLPRIVAPAGSVLLADPGRVHLDSFTSGMLQDGWRVLDLADRTEPSPAGGGRQVRVRILRIARSDDDWPAV